MSNVSSLLRSLFVYSICLPLAVILGYLMANPYDLATFSVVGSVLFLLLVPLLLKWHHTWLIATWNTSAVLFFLPGRPQIWLVLAWLSLLIGVGQYILNRNLKFLAVPSLIKPLLFLTVVVLVTARCTGGAGLQAMGSETYGGRKYITLLTGIIGFFAFCTQRIPPERAVFFVALFFLGALTQGIGDAASLLNPAFYFIFLIFPVNFQGMVNDVASSGFMARLGGLSLTASAVFYYMLSRFGIGEILSLRRLLRMMTFLFFVGLSMLGGFRSMLILFILTFAILFYFEGLIKSRLFPVILLCIVFGGALVAPFVDRLPFSIQRSLSFLPVEVSPIAKASAQDSTEWRLSMWRHLLPQIPQYFFLGKGYAINKSDFAMVRTADMQGGDVTGESGAEMAGDYHNGPLSVIIPFGIFGALAFLWFLIAGIRVLYQNYQFGDPLNVRINRFIFSYFLAKIIFFFVVIGGLASDMAGFCGLLGLSLSLNGGVAKRVLVPQAKLALNRFRLHPGARRPLGAQ